MSTVPAVVENYLEAIHCCEDGKIILGSSNLTGRYWNGSLWCFDNADDAPDVEKCRTGIDGFAGISDMAVLDNGCIAIGLDSGGLAVNKLDISSESSQFNVVFGAHDHDDYVSSLDLNSDQKSLVTAGADKCVKVWDCETWATTATFRPVHSGIIWQVSCSRVDPKIFLTCGQDGKVLLFDLRLPKPAAFLDINPSEGDVTAIAWKPGSDSTFVTGDESGSIAVRSLKGSESLCQWSEHKRRIHKLSFSNSNESWLASIADDTTLVVRSVKDESAVSIYKNDSHTDFIRDITWTKDDDSTHLISCGWDKKVVKHSWQEDLKY